MTHRIVVEPHADDAYLSLHTHITRWKKEGDKVTIITMFSYTRKRAGDAIAYAKAVGAEWYGMDLEEGERPERDLKIGSRLSEALEDDSRLWYIPLGIQNDDHHWVRHHCEDFIKLRNSYDEIFWYADIPYYVKKKNAEEFLLRADGKSINSIAVKNARKADEKYWKCFKDQSKFFYFNKPEDMAAITEFTFAENQFVFQANFVKG